MRFPLYLAALPLIFPAFLMFKAFSSSHSTNSAAETRLRARVCVETYGIKLSESQVLTGTARNACENPVKAVRLSIALVDHKSGPRVETIDIKEMEAGGSQRFERVLGGHVESWEIASDK